MANSLPASVATKLVSTISILRWSLIATVFCIVVLSVVVASLFPLKTIEPVYVEFSSFGNNFVTVKKANGSFEQEELFRNIGLRSYVVMRESVDQVTEISRYKCIRDMSSSVVEKKFNQLYIDKRNDGTQPLAGIKGFKRQIRLGPDFSIGKRRHRVEYTTVDTLPDEPLPKTNHWVAVIQYKLLEKNISLEELQRPVGKDGSLCNPIGLYIEDYTIERLEKE